MFLTHVADFVRVASADVRSRHRYALTERSGPPERKPQAGLREPGAALPGGADQQRPAETQGMTEEVCFYCLFSFYFTISMNNKYNC